MTDIDICNIAMGWLAGEQVADISVAPTSTEEQVCAAIYGPCRMATLEQREWSFAVLRRKLTLASPTPSSDIIDAYDGRTAFAKPSDLIRVLSVSESAKFVGDIEWLVEGPYIWAPANEAFLRYIYNVTDTTLFSAGFTHTLAARIAMIGAIPITGSKEHMDLMANIHNFMLDIASTVDGMQASNQPPKKIVSTIRVR